MNNGLQFFGGSGGLGSGSGGGGASLLLPQTICPIPSNIASTPFSGTSAVTTANAAYLTPFWVPRPCKVKALLFYVGGTTSSTFDVGLYKDAGNGGTTAVRLASSGAVTVNAAGLWSTATSVVLDGGDQRYFVVFTGANTGAFVFVGRASNGQGDTSGCFVVGGGGPTLGATLTLASFNTLGFTHIEVALKLVAA